MSSSDAGLFDSAVVEMLDELHRRRVRIWSDNGELRYRAPKGVLSREDLAKLTQWGREIIALLETRPQSAMPPLEPRRPGDAVPLTFSQFKYWQAYNLNDRATMRSVAFAVALSGPLDVPRLGRCAEQVVHRHEALRTRIAIVGGVPTQHIDQSCPVDLALHDLTDCLEQRRASEVQRLIHELILAPVRVTTGPLFGLRLAKIAANEHVLVIAMEHIISDGFSLNILLRDLLMLYEQETTGSSLAPPTIAVQLPDYAVWQSRAHGAWLARHGEYWQRRLAGCRRLTFPADLDAASAADADADAGYGTVPVRIAADLKEALREWCRTRRTTLVMAVFTAFAALVLRWCDSSDAVIRYQTDGRFSPLIENSIGYFAAVLNLRIELRAQDSLVDLLERATQEYCAAFEHADFSYIDAQVPRPGFTRNSGFNWVPLAPPVLPGATSAREPLNWRPWSFERPKLDGYEWDDEPSVILFEQHDGIEGTIFFSPRKISHAAMERFRDGLLMILQRLLIEPQRKVAQIHID